MNIDTKLLFGLEKNEFKQTCIILPVALKALLNAFDVKKIPAQVPFPAINCDVGTVIIGKTGAAYIGDMMLALEKTSCHNLILLGSCGVIEETLELKIGSLVTPASAYDLESFSMMLKGDYNAPHVVKPSTDMFRFFKEANRNVIEVRCATVGSILLEDKFSRVFRDHKIDVVDMECSAFFNAGRKAGKNILALFFVTDSVRKNNGYVLWEVEQKQLINDACVRSVEVLKKWLL
ncbi:MAG: hypothetical protein HQL25_02050 [Candidatus Omnitrophica bacterium]|nr:hypothetical protein [Candidatus Omnitrophota bacterium]